MNRAVIDIRDLRFAWPGQDAPCLDIESLQVEAGERVFIHGPSGSGKSTLLGLLGGVLAAQRGSIDVLGTRLEKLRPAQRDRFRADHIGFLFQLFNLIPYLSVVDNVVLAGQFSARRRAQALASSATLRDEAIRLLADLDLGGALLERRVTDLSVGQQQRVAAARAVLGRPEIIVADEPTSALDADRQSAFLDLLLHECDAAGTTLLFVSHDHRLAAHFTREIALHGVNCSWRERQPA